MIKMLLSDENNFNNCSENEYAEKDRFYFKNEMYRKEFFKEIKRKKFLTLKELADVLNTSKSVIDRYVSGQRTIPKTRFYKLLNFIPNGKRRYYINQISKIDGGWGRRKGGITTYLKHPELAEKARLKAIRIAQEGEI